MLLLIRGLQITLCQATATTRTYMPTVATRRNHLLAVAIRDSMLAKAMNIGEILVGLCLVDYLEVHGWLSTEVEAGQTTVASYKYMQGTCASSSTLKTPCTFNCINSPAALGADRDCGASGSRTGATAAELLMNQRNT